MSILSIEFLVFVLLVLTVYYILPLRIRWVTLLIASGVFIALSGWQGAAHLAAVSLVTWGGGQLIQRAEKFYIRRVCEFDSCERGTQR